MKRWIKIILWVISGIVGLFVIYLAVFMFVFPMRSQKQSQPPLTDREIEYFEHLQKECDLQSCNRFIENIERISPMVDTTKEFYYSIKLYTEGDSELQSTVAHSLDIANTIKDSLCNSSKNLTEILVHWKYIDSDKGTVPYKSFLFVCDTTTNKMILE